ncbi:MAG: hypothetical protein FWE52_02195 [Alphaproteobacteria bacterium]|nr:hypothetical protein [Alphaproteobacteria bacterium]
MIKLSKETFFDLERRLKDAGLDSDSESFDVIKKRLLSPEMPSADEFARQAIYVILAGGFSQKTAKKIHAKVMDYIAANPVPKFDDIIKFLNNKNKMNAIIKVWENRQKYRDGYYALAGSDLESKLSYLSSLPHIGKITANHLARNLGEDIVKYDIWIQRLGVAFVGREDLKSKIDNGNLDPDVKAACDEMFAHLVRETGLPRGYIDVVLWKSCQVGLIKL